MAASKNKQWNAQKTVKLGELVGLDGGKVSDFGGTHLGPRGLAQELLDLEVLDDGTGRLCTVDDGLRERVGVRVRRVWR